MFGEFGSALYFSWATIAFSCVIGYIILAMFRAKKDRLRKEELKRQALLKELGIAESEESLQQLQTKSRKQ